MFTMLRLYLISSFVLILGCQASLAAPDLTATALQGTALRYGLSLSQNKASSLSASYFNFDRNLYYLYSDSTGWHEELVTNVGIARSYFNFTTLVFIRDEPHIVFYHSGMEELKHAWKNAGGIWQTEIMLVQRPYPFPVLGSVSMVQLLSAFCSATLGSSTVSS